jgi:glycosyltransferase involved in cell wall biosynthesis
MGHHFVNLIYSSRAGVSTINICPIGQVDVPSDSYPHKYAAEHIGKFDPDMPTLAFWHLGDVERLGLRDEVSNYLITVSETTLLRPNELKAVEKFNKVVILGRPPENTRLLPRVEYSSLAVFDDSIFYHTPTDVDIDLISVGKWELRKGQSQIIAALGILSDQIPNIKIRVVGIWHNPFVPWWKAQMEAEFKLAGFDSTPAIVNDYDVIIFKKLGIKVTVYTSYITGRYMGNLYRRSAYLLFPSAGEGLGLPMLEASACGCMPIIGDIYPCGLETIGLQTTTQVANDRIFFLGDRGTWQAVPTTAIVNILKELSEHKFLYGQGMRQARSNEAKSAMFRSSNKFIDLMLELQNEPNLLVDEDPEDNPEE